MFKNVSHKLQILPGLLLCLAAAAPSFAQTAGGNFRVEEASITDIQNAIRAGRTSCKQVVQAYLERAKAYNGVCTALLTKDGAPIPPSTGMVRAGAPLKYPTETVAASTVFPDLDQYQGLPLEFGRMMQSVSDPSVQLQFGWRVGIPEAGQLNALETLNIRGERSVTCKGDFDRAPSAGPLPPGAPAACEEFRKQPDALERAAELDKQYGRNPDLAKLPMYCAVFSVKDWYDAKDMRGTGGNDVNFAMDVPKVDSPDIAVLRSKGAIIFAISAASNVTLAESAGARGPNKARRLPQDRSSIRPLERPDVQPIRYRARAAGYQQWVRRFRVGQPGDLRDLRTDLRVLQGAGVPEQYRQSPDDEGRSSGTAESPTSSAGGSRGHPLQERQGRRAGA